MQDESQPPLPESAYGAVDPAAMFTLGLRGRQTPGAGRSDWTPPSIEAVQAGFAQIQIVAVLGRGGMGAVYKGWQRHLDRSVAIKILPPEIEYDAPSFVERFQREARAMARLRHPGIVTVYDAGQTADGLLYFVMEHVEGDDVARRLAAQGRLPPAQALEIAARVCEALAYAHRHGVIHRDIKPSNVIVEGDGSVKVADFGLARIAAKGAAGYTRSEVGSGTPAYMAPEALEPGAQVDHRVDLFALGAMLYQMLTGHLPSSRFAPPSAQVPGLDPRFDAIVDRALQADRDARYPSADEMRADLAAIQSTPRREPPRRSALAVAAAVAVLLLVGAVLWWQRRPAPPVVASASPIASPRVPAPRRPAGSVRHERPTEGGRLRVFGTLRDRPEAMSEEPFAAYEDFVAVECNTAGIVALRSDGAVMLQAFYEAEVPHRTENLGVPPLAKIRATQGGAFFGLTAEGELRLLRTNYQQLAAAPPDLAQVVEVEAGALHAIALSADGHGTVWGRSFLAPPGTDPDPLPSADELRDLTHIAAGNASLAVLTRSGQVRVWGAGLGGLELPCRDFTGAQRLSCLYMGNLRQGERATANAAAVFLNHRAELWRISMPTPVATGVQEFRVCGSRLLFRRADDIWREDTQGAEFFGELTLAKKVAASGRALAWDCVSATYGDKRRSGLVVWIERPDQPVFTGSPADEAR